MYLNNRGSLKWGVSSAGRAPALQAGGHRFDPGTLHQKKNGVPDKADALVGRGETKTRASIRRKTNVKSVDLISTIWANSSAG